MTVMSSLRFAPLVMICVAGCSKPPAAQPAVGVTPAPAHASAPASDPAGNAVSGPVLETFDAASYTYVRVRGTNGEIWAAAPQFAVKVGDQVRVPLEMPMKDFHSASLNRDFPLIYFVSGITSTDAAAAPAPAAHGSVRAQSTVTTPMAAPAGGMTIASLWAARKELADKPVTVHGVIVKYNPGILGVNWIHLQDGTGKAEDGSNDITVTSTENLPIQLGDTIVAAGTAVVDRNIGSGYMYPVLVEKARISAVKKTSGS